MSYDFLHIFTVSSFFKIESKMLASAWHINKTLGLHLDGICDHTLTLPTAPAWAAAGASDLGGAQTRLFLPLGAGCEAQKAQKGPSAPCSLSWPVAV